MGAENLETGAWTKTYKYFEVHELPLERGRKTVDYDVVNLSGGYSIGTIRWYGGWRQFCFFPVGDTVWSAGCLRDVLDAMKKIDEERKRANEV